MNKDIDDKLEFLLKKAGSPLPPFQLKYFGYYFDNLTYEAHNSGAVSSVVDEVLKHYRIDSSKIHTIVEYSDKENIQNGEIRGQYSGNNGYGTIKIVIKPTYSEFDTVVAIIMHECSHYYKYLHNINLPNVEEDERLTDLTTIWLGGGSKLKFGYFPGENVNIGYIKKEEFLYAVNKTEEYYRKLHQK